MNPVSVEIYLDVICPYCFLQEATLARLEGRGDISVTVRGFEVHPDTPSDGLELADLGRDRVAKVMRQVRWLADDRGIRFVAPSRLPNSHLALEAIEMARASGGDGLATRMARALLQAYFERGEDVGTEPVLRSTAKTLGVQPLLRDRCFLARGYRRRVDEQRAAALADAITAVPITRVGGMPTFGVLGEAELQGLVERARRGGNR